MENIEKRKLKTKKRDIKQKEHIPIKRKDRTAKTKEKNVEKNSIDKKTKASRDFYEFHNNKEKIKEQDIKTIESYGVAPTHIDNSLDQDSASPFNNHQKQNEKGKSYSKFGVDRKSRFAKKAGAVGLVSVGYSYRKIKEGLQTNDLKDSEGTEQEEKGRKAQQAVLAYKYKNPSLSKGEIMELDLENALELSGSMDELKSNLGNMGYKVKEGKDGLLVSKGNSNKFVEVESLGIKRQYSEINIKNRLANNKGSNVSTNLKSKENKKPKVNRKERKRRRKRDRKTNRKNMFNDIKKIIANFLKSKSGLILIAIAIPLIIFLLIILIGGGGSRANATSEIMANNQTLLSNIENRAENQIQSIKDSYEFDEYLLEGGFTNWNDIIHVYILTNDLESDIDEVILERIFWEFNSISHIYNIETIKIVEDKIENEEELEDGDDDGIREKLIEIKSLTITIDNISSEEVLALYFSGEDLQEALLMMENMSTFYQGVPSAYGLINPLANGSALSSSYGWRYSPIEIGKKEFHNGMDFPASAGTNIYAVADGVIKSVNYPYPNSVYGGNDTGNANYIIIDHKNGMDTAYWHLKSVNVVVGQEVIQGHLIGTVGSTGWSTGPHLHFEVRIPSHPDSYGRNGTVNPYPYIFESAED